MKLWKRHKIWREKDGREIMLVQLVLIDVNTGKPLEEKPIKKQSKS